MPKFLWCFDKSMRYVFLLAVFIFGCALQAPIKYFPSGVFSADEETDSFVQSWYGKHLMAMKEPSLIDSALPQYRFLWLPTFHPPMVFRISVQNEKYLLYAKRAAGAGGYNSGPLVDDKVFEISVEVANKVINKLEQDCTFWTLPTKDGELGLDGSQWVFEAAKGGKYHVVDRWAPDSGCLYEVGVELMSLSKLKISEIY